MTAVDNTLYYESMQLTSQHLPTSWAYTASEKRALVHKKEKVAN